MLLKVRQSTISYSWNNLSFYVILRLHYDVIAGLKLLWESELCLKAII